jgi:1-acyl-sn-glycerol-3-phosphate acyltransferase
VAVAAALFARFPLADLPLLGGGVVRPFVDGVRDAVRHRRARRGLTGLCAWAFVALAVTVGLVRIGDGRPPEWPPDADAPSPVMSESRIRETAPWFAGAVLGGTLFAGLNRHPYRHAWAVPYAAAVGLACLLWLRVGHSWRGPLVGIGAALGATFTPLLNSYFTWTTPRHRGAAIGLLVAGCSAAALLLAGLLPAFGPDPGAARDPFLDLLVAVAALSAVGAWAGFFRPMVEGTAEIPLNVMYRLRSVGPGVERLPVRGPCLVIANHAAWFDPLWLGMILPAPITPMMTSAFYDLPVISWLMRRVFGTIRVPEAAIRHDAPELREAVEALDRGECIVLFPEGYLRRKEEAPLRRFGRGVWRILSDRPQTPVFACWIEGNWGSYFSYKGGPPTKNKRMDFWRPVRIAVTGPFTVDPAVLADHMATRTHLMERVNAARPVLGLEPLDLGRVSEGEKE